MVAIHYAQRRYELAPEQSVLEGLTAQGVPVPSSCRAGICQTCLLRATEGQPPEAAQQGLKDSLKLQNYFLACLCHPESDLSVALPGEAERLTATVRALERLNDEVMRVVLDCQGDLEYRPGQFLNLFRDRALARSYSIASVPGLDPHIHLHVRKLAGGQVSGWIHEGLQPGQTVMIQGPLGDCCYVPGQPEQPLLLIGTGSGLAPLYGIVRDALRQGHRGPIHLFHGSRSLDGLYLDRELRALARTHAQFVYEPCLSGPEVPEGYRAGRVHEVALRTAPKLQDWRLFLCGHPDMVQAAKKRAFLAGASLRNIHADAFTLGAN